MKVGSTQHVEHRGPVELLDHGHVDAQIRQGESEGLREEAVVFDDRNPRSNGVDGLIVDRGRVGHCASLMAGAFEYSTGTASARDATTLSAGAAGMERTN